ncbi:hypothetical protein EB796_019084 [Bugula neritina]|uniref:EF-hand domain-containing protein n=1 Tax=Bugula neritina TaxID=10212 RepID=A0A7J7J8N1_BUGNE|nr:hypothetical protein EB796_019084 [Bugula neritina]
MALVVLCYSLNFHKSNSSFYSPVLNCPTNGISFDQFLNILYNQFLNFLYNYSRAEDCENEIIAAFAAQDRKKNGLISAADFKAIMCNSGEKVNAKMVEAVLRESGQTGSQIRYAEVVRTLLSPPTDY